MFGSKWFSFSSKLEIADKTKKSSIATFYSDFCKHMSPDMIWFNLVPLCVSREVCRLYCKVKILFSCFLSSILIKSFGCRFPRFSTVYYTFLMVSCFHIRSYRKWICLPIPLILRLPLRDFLTCVYLYVCLTAYTDRYTLRPKLLLNDWSVLNL